MNENKRHPITGCRADTLFGIWICEVNILQQLVTQALSYDLIELTKINAEQRVKANKDDDKDKDPPAYTVDENKVAIMRIEGPLTKHPTSFSSVMGGNSYTGIQSCLREISQKHSKGEVKRMMLSIDSPGGTVLGAYECADAIAAVAKKMPVHAHIDGYGTSAAYLLASQAHRITTGRVDSIGSIGTVTVLHDFSGAYKAEGVKVIPVSSGKFKAVGAKGAEITEEQVKYVQGQIDTLNEQFVKTALISGRRMTNSAAKSIAAEARVYIGEEAKSIGLVDEITSYDQAMSKFVSMTQDQDQINVYMQSDDANRGPSQTQTNPAVSRSTAMALNATQLEEARKLPGAASITGDNAELVLLQVSKDLNASVVSQGIEILSLKTQVPVSIDATILAGRLEIAQGKIDLMTEKGLIGPVQSTALKDSLLIEGKPNKSMFTPMANGQLPYQPLFKALENNKPNGLVEKISGPQPVARQIPGEPDSSETNKAAQQASDWSNGKYGKKA